MVDRDELLCDTLEEFLLECTGDKVEEVLELPKMLADIFYLSDKEELLEQTTRCEILDIDDGFVTYDEVVGDEIHIHYSLDFILQTSIGPEPSTTEISSSSPSSAAATRQRPASSVLPVLPPIHLS